MNLSPTTQNAIFWASIRSHAEKPDNARELENMCKPDIHGALVAHWTCTKVMKEQWEKNKCFHTFCKNFENFILCIPEHLFSFTFKLLSVDNFRFCSIKQSRAFKNQNQFQILSRPLNRTPEIQGLSRCILTLK